MTFPKLQTADSPSLHRDMHRLLATVVGEGVASDVPPAWRPVIDTAEEATGFMLTVQLPGLVAGNIDVTVVGHRLSIKGSGWGAAPKGQDTRGAPRPRGTFRRELDLPANVVAGQITARYQDGVLTIRAPKASPALPRRIEVAGG